MSDSTSSTYTDLFWEKVFDDKSKTWGMGYSRDNGKNYTLLLNLYGRIFTDDDARKLYPLLKPYFGNGSSSSGGPVTTSLVWSDIIGKPDLVTEDELKQRLSEVRPTITAVDWSQITNKPNVVTNDELDKRLADLKPADGTTPNTISWDKVTDKPELVTSAQMSDALAALKSGSSVSLSGKGMSIDVEKGTIAFNGQMADPASVQKKQDLQAAVHDAEGQVDETKAELTSASNAYDALKSEGPAQAQSDTPLSGWSGFESVDNYPNNYYDLNFTKPISADVESAKFTIDIQEWVSADDNEVTVSLIGDDTDSKTLTKQPQQAQHQTIELTSKQANRVTGLHFTGKNLYVTAADVTVNWQTKGYTPEELSAASDAVTSAESASSSASNTLSEASSAYDEYEPKQVAYTFNVDSAGLSYTVNDQTTKLIEIPKKEDDKPNKIDVSNSSSNKKPSEYSDGIFYEKKELTSIGIDRSSYDKTAQDGSWGVLTTKCIKGVARQTFELLDSDRPLTWVRNGSNDQWSDWSGITNWN